ncbi:hypothetical protein H6P81_000690 [Aristolochia fimbriata]|uniref:Uncharacterized protein n=1 Tax=Aristolochia fimbriata TaxID=158543 RepID=A0AAV7F8T5_ARIFI|nr:hypothetical protein H6P81_000690 [Aristolochia fimbriata]
MDLTGTESGIRIHMARIPATEQWRCPIHAVVPPLSTTEEKNFVPTRSGWACPPVTRENPINLSFRFRRLRWVSRWQPQKRLRRPMHEKEARAARMPLTSRFSYWGILIPSCSSLFPVLNLGRGFMEQDINLELFLSKIWEGPFYLKCEPMIASKGISISVADISFLGAEDQTSTLERLLRSKRQPMAFLAKCWFEVAAVGCTEGRVERGPKLGGGGWWLFAFEGLSLFPCFFLLLPEELKIWDSGQMRDEGEKQEGLHGPRLRRRTIRSTGQPRTLIRTSIQTSPAPGLREKLNRLIRRTERLPAGGGGRRDDDAIFPGAVNTEAPDRNPTVPTWWGVKPGPTDTVQSRVTRPCEKSKD